MSGIHFLPELCGTALATAAAFIDVRERRIPNVLTFPGAGLGILFHLLTSGWEGMASAVAGLAIGAACLLPACLLRGMGAGDVKLLGAVGAWVGTFQIVRIIFYIAAIGGVMAIVKVIILKGVGGRRPALSLATNSKDHSETDALFDRRSSIPYGPAIAAGAFLNFLMSFP